MTIEKTNLLNNKYYHDWFIDYNYRFTCLIFPLRLAEEIRLGKIHCTVQPAPNGLVSLNNDMIYSHIEKYSQGIKYYWLVELYPLGEWHVLN